MTKDKFRELCEQVLIPRLGDMLYGELSDLHDTLDIMARELAQIGNHVDKITAPTGAHKDHADQR